MSALRKSSERRLSILDEVLRAHARYRVWRRRWRAGLAGVLLLLTLLISRWPGAASAPTVKVTPGILVVSVPVEPGSHASAGGMPTSWRAAPRSR